MEFLESLGFLQCCLSLDAEDSSVTEADACRTPDGHAFLCISTVRKVIHLIRRRTSGKVLRKTLLQTGVGVAALDMKAPCGRRAGSSALEMTSALPFLEEYRSCFRRVRTKSQMPSSVPAVS
jgi:hypothetical protein